MVQYIKKRDENMSYVEIINKLSKLFLPILVTYILFTSRFIVDAIFVSAKFGIDGVAALSLVSPFNALIYAVGFTITIGTMTYVGYNIGKGNTKHANESFSTMIYVAIIITVVISILLFLFSNFIYDSVYIDSGNSIKTESLNYLYVALITSPILSIGLLGSQMLLIEEKLRFKIVLVVSSFIVNIVANYIFLYVFNLPLYSAAIGTAIAALLDALVTIIYFKYYSKKVKIIKPNFKDTKYYTIIINGVSDGMIDIANSIKIVMYNFILLKMLGTSGVAMFGYITYIFSLTSMTLFSLSDSLNPIISVEHGKGEYKNIYKIMRTTLLLAFALSIIIYILVIVFDDQLYGIFNIDDPLLYADTIRYSKIYLVTLLLFGLNQVFTSYLTATHQAIKSLIFSLYRNLVIIVISMVVLTLMYGIEGLWYAGIVTEIISLISIVIYFLIRKRNNHKLI